MCTCTVRCGFDNYGITVTINSHLRVARILVLSVEAESKQMLLEKRRLVARPLQ
jgi:hypothetical protein